ncbi:MAG: class I SAM-dependent RNA methyltransferase [Deltaproteobacteria bacterium]|nr:class I SAM-dependent RNA methyltransferase [Deltaproteobacteria bacterium]MBW2360886.1 class I SAM-dependent RNA methyltransferase [Deltaproteobacteria bacterium]
MPVSDQSSVEVRVERLAAGGDGVGRLPDGRVVFVPLTAPGDLARVAVTELRARHARAELVELLEPSLVRVEPRCAVFGVCGGCTWQHLAYATQLEAKQAIVADALRRIGRVEWTIPIEITASPSAYHYRGRTRVQVEAGVVGYRRRGSRALCATRACPVLLEHLEERLGAFAADAPRRDGEWELAFAAGASRATPLSGGDGPRLTLHVGGDAIGISPGAFAQSNALLHERLAERVFACAGRGGCALELYAGAGFFTLGLARRFDLLVAVEASPVAVDDLRENLAAARLEHVEIFEADVASEAWLAPAGVTDLALLDPPRTGLPRSVIERLLRIAPRRLVYLSCDPATLARDLGHLLRGGYELRHVEAFDLFPQTPHVEVLVALEGDPHALPGASG